MALIERDLDVGILKKDGLAFRLRVISFLLVLVGIIIILRVLMLGMSGRAGRVSSQHAVRARPDIVDRNGVIIATDLPAFDICVDRTFRGDARAAGAEAAALLGLSVADVIARVEAAAYHGRFSFIARQVSPEVRNALRGLGFCSIPSRRRVYPDGLLFAHLLGSVDVDNNALGGMERFLDTSGLVEHGMVQLSVDRYVQTAVRSNLLRAQREWGAIKSAGIVMDVQSGEILALVSLPDERAGRDDLHANHATVSRFEPGSVIKIFNHALAIENNFPRYRTFNVLQPFFIGRHRVRDSNPPRAVIDVDQAFIYSSNIVSAQMALYVGAERQRAFFERLGFFRPVALELPEVSRPTFPSRWTDITTASAAFGYGIALTPLHILVAANSIVNFGMSVQPTLLKRSPDEPRRYVQKVSFETAREMKDLMERAVVDGTGRRARGARTSVMGKTGGAQKLINGVYSPNHLRTFFLSAFPVDEPRYTMIIMLDEARNGACFSASCTAVVVSQRIIDEIEPMLNL